MKIIILILLSYILIAQDTGKIMDDFVYKHLLLTKSKMSSSPLAWQDLKEGFLPRTTFEEFFISDDLEIIFDFISKFKKKDGKDWYKRLER